jgi:hypothetical protein
MMMNSTLHGKGKSDPGMTAMPVLAKRHCACGNHSLAGACRSCGQKSQRMMRREGVNFAGTSDVQRAPGNGGRGRVPHGTNYAFDTYQVTEAHLSDPDVTTRFESLSRKGLIDYRRQVSDPAVKAYIDTLLAKTPPQPCTAKQIASLNSKAENARTASVPWVAQARSAVDRLQSRWIDNKADILAKNITLTGEVVCAFDSNFNINQRDADYGVEQIKVAARLKHLESRLSKPVAYACQPDDDPICLGKPGQPDTIAYVLGGKAPIHFCQEFLEGNDEISDQATVIHEYSHLLPGVTDQGGYALGGFGAQVMTCSTGAKFKATPDVLRNTADALAGFVMHIGQTNAADLKVTQGSGAPATPTKSAQATPQPVTVQPPATTVKKEEAEGTKVSVLAAGEAEVGKDKKEAGGKVALEIEVPLSHLEWPKKRWTFGIFNKLTISPGLGFKPGDEKFHLFTPLVLEGALQMGNIEWQKMTRAGFFKLELGAGANASGEWVPQTNEHSVKFGFEGGAGAEWRLRKEGHFFIKIEAKAQAMWVKENELKLQWGGVSFAPQVGAGWEF